MGRLRVGRFWYLAVTVLSACSTADLTILRKPASVNLACNRQSLGRASSDNQPLVQYNAKRVDTLTQLFQEQIKKLTSKMADGELKQRLAKLAQQQKSISQSELQISLEPNEVTWRLRQALDVYLADISIDEQKGGLGEADLKKFNYVRESLQPNLSRVDYWMPDFCRSTTGQVSSDFFRGL